MLYSLAERASDRAIRTGTSNYPCFYMKILYTTGSKIPDIQASEAGHSVYTERGSPRIMRVIQQR